MSKRLLKGDRDELGAYLGHLADLMGLRDWTIGLANDPPQSDPHDGHIVEGECLVSYGRKVAMIAVPANWDDQAPDELRRVLVHELIHCHQEPVQWAFNTAANRLGFEAGSVARDAFTGAFEVAVDGIATAWARTLPLPVKEKAK